MSRTIAWPRLPHGLRAADDDSQWQYNPGLHLSGTGHLRSFMTTDAVWLVVVSQLGIGCSIVNAAEDIYATLVEEYGSRLLYLEHWSNGQRYGEGATLDMVVAPNGVPSWRRVWPLPDDHERHDEMAAWIRGDGAVLLDALDWDGPR